MILKRSTIKLISIFIFIGIVQFIIDLKTNTNINKCISTMNLIDKNKILLALLSHHIIVSFLHYSWIVKDRIIITFRLLLTIAFYIQSFYYKKCFLTVYINNKCKIDDYFHDMMYVLGCKKDEKTLENTEFWFYFITNLYIIFNLIYTKPE
jgi:hypothetical protein